MEKICGECRHHRMETKTSPDKHGRITASCQVRSGWICGNYRSDYYGLWTDYTDTCEAWEQRGVD